MDDSKSGLEKAYPKTHGDGFELRLKYLYEAIVGVLDSEGKPHFTPVGVRIIDNDENERFVLESRVYTASTLHSCLKRGGNCTLHFPGTSQLEFFFLPFRHQLPGLQDRLASPGRVKSGLAQAPPVLQGIANYMVAAVSWIEDEVVNDAIAVMDGKKIFRGVFRFVSKTLAIGDSRCRPASRHDGLVLELLVKASRFHHYPPGSKEQEASLSDLFSMLGKMESIAPGDEKNVLARTLLASLKHAASTRP